jgi:hypothetical protein
VYFLIYLILKDRQVVLYIVKYSGKMIILLNYNYIMLTCI